MYASFGGTPNCRCSRLSAGAKGRLWWQLASCGIDPIQRITLRNRLEIGQRRADGEREVLAAAQRDAHVLAEDGCPLLRRHRHEANAAMAPLADYGVAMRGLDVLHPIRPRAEHRYEVMFALHGGDHHGDRASAAGCAATDFEGGLEPRRQPDAGPPARKPVDPPAKARRAPVAVKQPHECATLSRVGRP